MKTIKLLGDIADDYKADWRLDVKSPAEALRAINANRPGFLAACDAGEYIAVLVDENDPDSTAQVTDKNADDAWGEQVLYILPRVSGDYAAVAALVAYLGTGTALTTTAIVAGTAVTTLTTLGTIVAVIATIALTVAVSMIASLIAGTPDGFGANETEEAENKPSYLFNGVVNTAKQGHRIPVLYGGPLLVGSMVLSSRINTKDIPV